MERYSSDLASVIDEGFFISRENAEDTKYPEVLLRLQITKSGVLEELEVERGSGLTEADERALAAVNAGLNSFGPLPNECPPKTSFLVSFSREGATAAWDCKPSLAVQDFLRKLQSHIRDEVEAYLWKRSKSRKTRQPDTCIGLVFREDQDWYSVMDLDPSIESPDKQKIIELATDLCSALSANRPRFSFEVRLAFRVDNNLLSATFPLNPAMSRTFVVPPNQGRLRRQRWFAASNDELMDTVGEIAASPNPTAEELATAALLIYSIDRVRSKDLMLKAVQADPRSAIVQYRLGQNLYQNRDQNDPKLSLQEALTYLERAKELEPQERLYLNAVSEVHSVLLIHEGRYRDAVSFATETVMPSYIHSRWAIELESLGDFDNAACEWRKALELSDRDDDHQVASLSERIRSCEKNRRT